MVGLVVLGAISVKLCFDYKKEIVLATTSLVRSLGVDVDTNYALWLYGLIVPHWSNGTMTFVPSS